MSREDYAYGLNNLTSNEVVITVPLAGGMILPPSATRVGVRFSSPTTNRVTILSGRQPILDGGYNAYPATARGPEFCAAIQGSITQKPFYGIAAVADQVIVCVETHNLRGD